MTEAMSRDTSHLVSLERLASAERARLANAKSDFERKMRTVWLAQFEKEIASERAFLGMPAEVAEPEMSDDELLAELEA